LEHLSFFFLALPLALSLPKFICSAMKITPSPGPSSSRASWSMNDSLQGYLTFLDTWCCLNMMDYSSVRHPKVASFKLKTSCSLGC
jgi:hypothetical protein